MPGLGSLRNNPWGEAFRAKFICRWSQGALVGEWRIQTRKRGEEEEKDTLLRRSPLWKTENQSSWEQQETGRTYILTILAKGWKADPSVSAYDRLSHIWAKRNPQMESPKCLQSYPPATDTEFWMSKQSKDGTNNIC